MLKYIILFLCTIYIYSPTNAQDSLVNQSEALRWASSIDSNDMKRHLFYLASDYLSGRETGTRGNNLAARYIADFFKKNNYQAIDKDGDYFQEIMFSQFKPDTTILTIQGKAFEHFEDFVVIPYHQKPISDFATNRVYFAGFGLETEDYSDYGNYDWEGKTIIIYRNIPEEIGSNVTDSTVLELNSRLKTAQEKGVEAIFIIHDQFNNISALTKRYLLSGYLNLGKIDPQKAPLPPHAMVSSQLAKYMVGFKYEQFLKERSALIRKGGLSGKPLKLRIKVYLDWVPELKFVESQNIVAYLPGSDPKLKDQIIVATAHMDHLGERAGEVYNGADDDASGTTTILEVSETVAEARTSGDSLKRSLLFVLMTGEEKGLLGSRYYVQNPLLPLDQTVANVNIDMVGRVDQKYRDSVNYLYVIGADRISQDLHDINELANKVGPQLILDYTYNKEDDPNRFYYRSDHYNFAKNGIPVIFYFNGTHEDYHRLSDTPEKINYPFLSERAKLVFLTIWELCQRPERIKISSTTK